MSGDNVKRRAFLKTTGGLTAAGVVAGCTGDGGDGGDGGDDDGTDYPTDDIRNVVPFATGGGFDAYARLMEPYWAEYLDTEVVTENITGGGGVNGGTEVYNAEPDGHTFMIWAPGEALPSQIGQEVGYDIRDMSHIGFVTQTPSAIILRDDTGIETWDEFVDNMDSLDWATQGVGTMAHVGVDILAELTGEFSREDVNYVHYAGTGEVLSGLERGEANAFLITAGDSGASVVQSIEGTNMFLVFSGPENIGDYFDDAGVEVQHYATDLDGVEGLDDMATVSSMRRFYAGPPDVSDDVLEVQREAFQNIVDDDDFIDDTEEADRPVIQPGDHTDVQEAIDDAYELMTSDPYQGIIEDAF